MLRVMTRGLSYCRALVSCAAIGVCTFYGAGSVADPSEVSPIYGITMPAGYRDWAVVAVSHIPEDGPNRLKAILGNPAAIKAYRDGTVPFPDGAMLAKIEWSAEQHPEQPNKTLGEPSAFVPGELRQIGFMVKDSKKYASTGGWGYGEFKDGKPEERAGASAVDPPEQAPRQASMSNGGPCGSSERRSRLSSIRSNGRIWLPRALRSSR